MAPFVVLHVCTANVCRSAMAETVLRAELAVRLSDVQRGAVHVESAGLRGHDGADIDAGAQRALARCGLSAPGFTARGLVAGQVEAADLVLTATRDQRHRLGETDPGAYPRTFTLLEMAWLVGGMDLRDLPEGDVAARGRELARRCATERGVRRPPHPQEHDLADPYLGRRRAYRRCLSSVQTAVGVLARALAPVPADVAAGPSGPGRAQPARSLRASDWSG